MAWADHTEYECEPITRDEARKQDLLYFFEPIKCKEGHIAPRLVKTGQCIVCHRIKDNQVRMEMRQKNMEQYGVFYKWMLTKPVSSRAKYVNKYYHTRPEYKAKCLQYIKNWTERQKLKKQQEQELNGDQIT